MTEDNGADLVRKAFEMARLSGKDPWDSMTIAVLKNRILTISGGKFNEGQFGVPSFRAFLALHVPSVITIDDSRRPSVVTLSTAETGQSEHDGPSYSKIRPDLWRAILDYSSGRVYVWDDHEGVARVAVEHDERPRLPTASAEEFAAWRQDFAVNHQSALSGEPLLRLQRWAGEGLPTLFLPAHVRLLWNGDLKKRVESRLREWFAEREFQPPANLVFLQPATPTKFNDASQLRRFLIACIEGMSEEELRSLQIPAASALRTKIS